MTRRYAQDTSVSSDRSKAEIERTLQRFGADQFAWNAAAMLTEVAQ